MSNPHKSLDNLGKHKQTAKKVIARISMFYAMIKPKTKQYLRTKERICEEIISRGNCGANMWDQPQTPPERWQRNMGFPGINN